MNWNRILDRYGALGLIAVFLVWSLVGGTARALDRIEHMLEYHVYRTDSLLFAICINAARDDSQRALCSDAPRQNR